MTDQQREGIQMLWSLGRSARQISADLNLSLADVCGAIAEFSGRPADSPMRQRELFESQPMRDEVSDR